MEKVYVELAGFVAGACTAFSFLPQIFKMAKTGKVRDISISMYLVLSFGVFLWLIYGIYLGELPIIVANSISLFFCLIILGMKVGFSFFRQKEGARDV